MHDLYLPTYWSVKALQSTHIKLPQLDDPLISLIMLLSFFQEDAVNSVSAIALL